MFNIRHIISCFNAKLGKDGQRKWSSMYSIRKQEDVKCFIRKCLKSRQNGLKKTQARAGVGKGNSEVYLHTDEYDLCILKVAFSIFC